MKNFKIDDILIMKNSPHLNPELEGERELIGEDEGDITHWRIVDIIKYAKDEFYQIAPFYEGKTFGWNHENDPPAGIPRNSPDILGKLEIDPEIDYIRGPTNGYWPWIYKDGSWVQEPYSD